MWGIRISLRYKLSSLTVVFHLPSGKDASLKGGLSSAFGLSQIQTLSCREPLSAFSRFSFISYYLQGAKEEMKSAGYEGVLLGGNYVAGVALGKCVEYAYEYANEIERYLQSKQSTVGIETTAKQDEPFFV